MNEQTMVTAFLIALVVVHLVVGLLCLYLLKRDLKAQAASLDAMLGPKTTVNNFTVGDVASMQKVREAVRHSQTYGQEDGPTLFGTARGKQAPRPTPPAEPEPA